MTDDREALALIADQARRLLQDRASPERLKSMLEQPGSFDAQLWRETAELGWGAVALPEESGGLGLGWEALCRLLQPIGESAVSLPLIPNALLAEALRSGTAPDAGLIAALASGERIATIAFAEAGESGIPASPSLSFAGGRLNGTKAMAPFAAVADYALVHASCEQGVALLCVELSQSAVRRQIADTIDNAQAAASLQFADAAAKRLDDGRSGIGAVMKLAAIGATLTAFEQLGGAGACLRMASDYARQRTVFAQPIGSFQAIKHGLADVYGDLEIARGCALDALIKLEAGARELLPFAAAARVATITAYEHAAQKNIQVHGGIGVTWEAWPHHFYRRSRALALAWGGAPFWRELLVDNVQALAEAY